MKREDAEQCPLFKGLTTEEYLYALEFFEVRTAAYHKGELLSRLGTPLSEFGFVLSGTIQVYMHDLDGNPIIMANVGRGGTFGESLCFLGTIPPIYIHACTDASILWMKTDGIKRTDDIEEFSEIRLKLTNRFITLLSSRTLSMNDRVQILSKISLRDKLITYFSQQMNRFQSNRFTVPFNRSDMAVYLGTNRSALSRELSHMRDEGILEFENNRFRIHQNFEQK